MGNQKRGRTKKMFILACLEKKFDFKTICYQFDISRPTGYLWLDRFEKDGWEGLKERSRRPLSTPNATLDEIENAILNIKYEYTNWGAKKILPHLKKINPLIAWPSKTTVEKILKKNGLVKQRTPRKRLAIRSESLSESNFSNDIWCMDFKGWWLTKDQFKCEPFTLTDSFSRFLFCCQNLDFNNTDHVWGVIDRVFREYGLPMIIKSDNGAPFASLGPGRLSKLAIKLIKAGITPEWIEPGKPQQNGSHERMHRTLKDEGMDLNLNLDQQILKLEKFKDYYNYIRPHESINQQTPGKIYTASQRNWNGRLKSPEYSREYKVGKVQSCGKMWLNGRRIYIGRAFEGEPIGLKVDGENLNAYYGPMFLGCIIENSIKVDRRPGRIKLKI